MSEKDETTNPGADATEHNLAGTPDEFNDEVTARLVQDSKSERREQREDQPALETDEDSPASEAKPSS